MSGKGRKPQGQRQDLSKAGTRVNERPPEIREERTLTYEAYEGLLPHPTIVKGWEEIEAGSFGRIIEMAEKDQNAQLERNRHEMAMERLTAQANIRLANRELNLAAGGQIGAIVITVVLIIAAVYLLATGIELGGYVTLGVALAPVAIALINRRAGKEAQPKSGK